MGGFTLNGCGTGDSFHPVRVLGNHYCKYCKSVQEYDLMEVKRKIKVFYIPTVSINTKYAVACKKCKNGFYIEDSLRDDLLYGRKGIEVESGEIRYTNAAGNSPKQLNSEDGQTAEKAGFCPSCGAKLQQWQAFCTSCGVKLK